MAVCICFFLCSPDCTKQLRIEYPFYRFLCPMICGTISGIFSTFHFLLFFIELIWSQFINRFLYSLCLGRNLSLSFCQSIGVIFFQLLKASNLSINVGNSILFGSKIASKVNLSAIFFLQHLSAVYCCQDCGILSQLICKEYQCLD